MKLNKVVNIADLREAARRRLPLIAFDYIDGGVEDERCLARNREAFARHCLLPRYLVDVSKIDRKTTLFGKTYDSPFGISPTGLAGLWRPGADDMLADAARKANIPFALSCAANSSIESVAKRAAGNAWFQLYSTRNRDVGRTLVERVRDLDVETLVITVDVPVSPRRERNLRNGFTRPLRFKLSTVIDGLTRPSWLIGYLRAGGGTPMMPNWAPFLKAGASPDEVADFFATQQTPAAEQTWSDLERYRALWPRKLVLKGILHPEDAARAASLGVDGLIVSNHGARQLDTAPSAIEMLPSIRAAVGDRMVLMMDGGVRRGSDVLIALCLGAQFVFMGRPTLYGVSAFGLPGAERAIDIIRTEIDINMKQIGCPDIASLGPHCLMQPPTHRPEWTREEAPVTAVRPKVAKSA
jgi:isopentenyl diphosphate isomerase/L-lactate dehydrogenase-like FMN-dependent dehydrogenase